MQCLFLRRIKVAKVYDKWSDESAKTWTMLSSMTWNDLYHYNLS